MQPHWWDVQECGNRRKEQTKRKNKPQASLWKALTCLWLDPFHKGELWWAGVAACNEYHDNIFTPPPTHHCSDYVNRCFYISDISLISTRQIWQMCKKYINYISDSSYWALCACLYVRSILPRVSWILLKLHADVGLIHIISFRHDTGNSLPSVLWQVRLLNSRGIWNHSGWREPCQSLSQLAAVTASIISVLTGLSEAASYLRPLSTVTMCR